MVRIVAIALLSTLIVGTTAFAADTVDGTGSSTSQVEIQRHGAEECDARVHRERRRLDSRSEDRRRRRQRNVHARRHRVRR